MTTAALLAALLLAPANLSIFNCWSAAAAAAGKLPMLLPSHAHGWQGRRVHIMRCRRFNAGCGYAAVRQAAGVLVEAPQCQQWAAAVESGERL